MLAEIKFLKTRGLQCTFGGLARFSLQSKIPGWKQRTPSLAPLMLAHWCRKWAAMSSEESSDVGLLMVFSVASVMAVSPAPFSRMSALPATGSICSSSSGSSGRRLSYHFAIFHCTVRHGPVHMYFMLSIVFTAPRPWGREPFSGSMFHSSMFQREHECPSPLLAQEISFRRPGLQCAQHTLAPIESEQPAMCSVTYPTFLGQNVDVKSFASWSFQIRWWAASLAEKKRQLLISFIQHVISCPRQW